VEKKGFSHFLKKKTGRAAPDPLRNGYTHTISDGHSLSMGEEHPLILGAVVARAQVVLGVRGPVSVFLMAEYDCTVLYALHTAAAGIFGKGHFSDKVMISRRN